MSKILVVDDNFQNRELARATLEDEGHDVVLAIDGTEALAAFEREHPDCVLLDVRMPGLDGFAVCTRIRALPEGRDVPIVFLTALRDIDTFDQALRAGGDDFLTKPVRPTELLVRVQAALKLRKMSAELREHYDLVRRQRDDLMRLQLQKERLTSFVVHDLKNPVGAMDLHAQVLLADRSLPQKARDTAEHIRSDARSLMRLILNLLDISKSEEGKLAPRPAEVDLAAITRDALESVRLKAQLSGVNVAAELPETKLRADADLLRRVFENLFDNAIRHTPKGGKVELSSRVDGDRLSLTLSDSGPGVPAELRERIFDPFVQAEGGQRSVGGRGLGLTFCRLAVEAHGGRIWVEDGSPGARFCIDIPLWPPAADEAP